MQKSSIMDHFLCRGLLIGALELVAAERSRNYPLPPFWVASSQQSLLTYLSRSKRIVA